MVRVQNALWMGVTCNSENYFIPHYHNGVDLVWRSLTSRWQLSRFTAFNLGKVT